MLPLLLTLWEQYQVSDISVHIHSVNGLASFMHQAFARTYAALLMTDPSLKSKLLLWNTNQNETNIFFDENAVENYIYKTSIILFMLVKSSRPVMTICIDRLVVKNKSVFMQYCVRTQPAACMNSNWSFLTSG